MAQCPWEKAYSENTASHLLFTYHKFVADTTTMFEFTGYALLRHVCGLDVLPMSSAKALPPVMNTLLHV